MTLKDVASAAQVSIMTASKVMRDDPSVRTHLRQRVLAAAHRLDYRPNQVARGLRNQESSLVSLAMGELWNPFFGALAHRVAQALSRVGKEAVLAPCADDVIALRHSYAACGCIACYGLSRDNIDLISKRQKMVTLLGAGLARPQIPDISIDFASVYRELAEALLARGCRRVVCCSDEFYYPNPEHKKFDVVAEVYRQAGYPLVVPPAQTSLSVAELLRRLAQQTDYADAVLCENDTLAARLVAGLHQLGGTPAARLVVVGCDGIWPVPGTWTVRVNITTLADAAVELFLRELHGQPRPERTLFRPELLTDIPASAPPRLG
jgi:LacI family transcriptional regulator